VRIARTAHRLGIDTVGVYSEPDADALHVDVVDLAVALGGSTPAESYLRADASSGPRSTPAATPSTPATGSSPSGPTSPSR
jgi:biotin carboxylase